MEDSTADWFFDDDNTAEGADASHQAIPDAALARLFGQLTQVLAAKDVSQLLLAQAAAVATAQTIAAMLGVVDDQGRYSLNLLDRTVGAPEPEPAV